MTHKFLKTETMREKRQAVKKILLSSATRSVLMMIILVVGILHVVQISNVSTRGYDVSALERKVTLMERELDKIEYEIAMNRTMESIEGRLAANDFAQVTNARYVHAGALQTVVAQR